MKKSLLTRFMVAVIITAILADCFGNVSGNVSAETSGTKTKNNEFTDTGAAGAQTVDYAESDNLILNEAIASGYSNIQIKYTAPLFSGEIIEFSPEKTYISGDGILTDDTYGYENKAVSMKMGDTAVFRITVPRTAQYLLRMDYISYDDSILPVEISMKVNGEFPFYEARRILLESTWVSREEKAYDRYGNEIVTMPQKLKRWESKYLMDSSYRHSEPLIIELEEGDTELTFEVSEGTLLLGNLYLEPVKFIPEYAGSNIAEGNRLIVIQGEDFTYRNDSSIRAVAEFDADLDPYKVTDTLLNTIDSDSFKNAGQRVTYEFNVEEPGYYYIGVNYRQSDKSDFPVFMDIAIDGEIPNTAFKAYPFMYTTKYRTETLKYNDSENLSIYLDKGVHTLSFTIQVDNIRHVLEAVSRIMSEINDLALEITKVAGTNKDKYRDLKITRYIPDVQERLYGWADELDGLHDSVKKYNPKVKKIAAFSSISIASNQLRSLAEEPNELPYRVAELSSSVNSVTHHLANLVDTLDKNNIAIDRIYIYQEDAALPKKVNFLKKTYLNIVRFFASFFDRSYSTSNVNKEHLQVWVNRPRQYLEIMQKMIDEQFTPQTGIEVDLSLMPDPNKLVLANSSGDAPDIAAGINYTIPFELGIRGATKDLTEFEDFKEIAKRFPLGIHIPATIDDGIYALPETMNFWVLFYRTDILDKLNLSVPDTIEDVIDMLPELQMRGFNFYYPTAGMTVMRNFHGTTPLLFQHGATLYDEYAGKTTINSEEGIEGFKMLTELFTIYSLPVDIPNFYQHFRNGDLPIGIGDYGVYNLLVNAAPEIANSWEIGPVPGIRNDDGEILRYTCGGAESMVMFRSNKEREEKAWKFMKWWTSAEVQTEFGKTLQISYGDEYIWNTANLEAFESLPWDTKDKEVILEQANWVMEPPRILGTYMLEREISNAFNDIVVNGKSLRTRIDKAVKTIDRETMRKLEEFGYIKDGKVVKEYRVPTLEHVKEILGIDN